MTLLLMHLSIIKIMIKKKIPMLTLQIQILIIILTITQTLSKLVQVKDLKQIIIHPN